jgi:hypothetical protein
VIKVNALRNGWVVNVNAVKLVTGHCLLVTDNWLLITARYWSGEDGEFAQFTCYLIEPDSFFLRIKLLCFIDWAKALRIV